MGNNNNVVKVSLPAANALTVPFHGLAQLLDDLSALGANGVLVTEVRGGGANVTPEFVVSLSAAQLAGLINQHAFLLLAAKYSD